MNPKKNDYYVSLESVLLVARFILTTFPSDTSLWIVAKDLQIN